MWNYIQSASCAEFFRHFIGENNLSLYYNLFSRPLFLFWLFYYVCYTNYLTMRQIFIMTCQRERNTLMLSTKIAKKFPRSVIWYTSFLPKRFDMIMKKIKRFWKQLIMRVSSCVASSISTKVKLIKKRKQRSITYWY